MRISKEKHWALVGIINACRIINKRLEAAVKFMLELLGIEEEFSTTEGHLYDAIWSKDDIEKYLQKAGLEIEDED